METVKLELNGQMVRVKREKAFPNRYSWECPKCKNWNRWFELTCPTCDWDTSMTFCPILNQYVSAILD